jgi:hypothetical protein
MRQETVRSGSSAGTGRRPRTVLSVERRTVNTCTVVQLTLSPGASVWLKRLLTAQLALDTAALVGSSIWTSVRAHL